MLYSIGWVASAISIFVGLAGSVLLTFLAHHGKCFFQRMDSPIHLQMNFNPSPDWMLALSMA